MGYTSILIREETKEQLKDLKEYNKSNKKVESYENVITRLIKHYLEDKI